MIAFFKTILYIPIYNLLIFIAGLLPHGDMGLALVLAALAVRLVILPLSISAVRTQRAMKQIEPELNEIKEKYKNDTEKQAKEQFALYKQYGIHPFASLLLIVVQLPILLSLYFVVRGESLTKVDTALLYPFVHAPISLSPMFLGLVSISHSSLILSIIVAATQFAQAYYAIPLPEKVAPKKGSSSPGDMQQEFGRAMALQARFVLPIVMGVISYASGAIALYFITSNVVMLFQELVVRTTIKPLKKVPQAA